MKEKVARMEETLAQVLGQKLHQLPAADQAGSQYQSAEQLIDEIDHQSISRQVSAIMDQQRSILDRNEDEEVKQRDPFNIPEEEEFFIARQTFRTTANQS